ncbi:MAG: 2-oxoacid:acceptor oxidoreductase subunit alpha [Candidatus Promineifilaceae bacterium]|nr:2-oxoacid:acceptor oxidoreductase subunit alpha [Candidatus Promineifilaceae bacterium]
MSVIEAEVAPRQREGEEAEAVVNDFSIVVATANGTGSQTSNLTLLRALFKMGIPVNGKNIFPSNIQGLPTWYHIRVSHEGFVARRDSAEVLVAFNEETVDEDIAALPSGGVCIYSDDWRNVSLRDDVINYAVPVNQFLRQAGVRGKLRSYMANMVYVGALAQLLDISLQHIEEALSFHFNQRQKLVDQNMEIVRLAHEWTAENIAKRDPYRVEPLDLTADKILITGNEAAALGAVFGGVTLTAWYPITPSTSLVDALTDMLPRLRRDPETGQATYSIIQAEDELAAAGMVVGGGWAGARAMTATSGPGISLMAEFIGLAYFAEIPSVFWDIQRVGPSTGLPTRTSQGDVLFAYFLGHGDTRNVLLLPATVAECFEFGYKAFDLADQIQTPVLVLSDLDLGMNTWMTDQFTYPEEPLKRGKVLSEEEVEEQGFARYLDLDGDGIPYRTVPGNEHPKAAWFARGTGHNEYAVYSEKPEDWKQNMARLNRKFDTARQLVPAPVLDEMDGAEVGIIAYGSTLAAVEEARQRLADEGVATDFLRIRALPINDEVRDFVEQHQRVYVVELNRDGQLFQILQLDLPDLATDLISLAHLDGMPLTARWVTETLMEKEQSL